MSMMKRFSIRLALLAILLCPAIVSLQGQTYQLYNATLPGYGNGGTSWGDVDNDGDLDLVMNGNRPDGSSGTSVMRNKNGQFLEVTAGLPSFYGGSAAWGDFDNDNDLDLLLCGTGTSGEGSTLIFRNDNGTFVQVPAYLTGIASGEAIWLDYNNDSFLDVLITGDSLYNNPVTRLYRNNGDQTFTLASDDFFQALYACVAAGDYDNDGDVDVFLTGARDTADAAVLYRNDGGVFTESGIPFMKASYGDAILLDKDMDMDLDILYMGSIGGGYYGFYTYVNNGDGTFTKENNDIEGQWVGRIDAADINNDGYPDLGVTGSLCCGDANTDLYVNDGTGHFTLLPNILPDETFSQINFGDVDNDGDADLILTGIPPDFGGQPEAKIYRNTGGTNTVGQNTPPSSPATLASIIDQNDVTLSWDASSDPNTPAPALTYNLRIGTSPGTTDIVAPLSDPATGFARVYAPGNAGQNLSWQVNDLPAGTYYWSVQALDHTGAPSPFAAEQTFTITWVGIGADAVKGSLFSSYPNPTSGTFTLYSDPSLAGQRFQIHSATGTCILEGIANGREQQVTLPGNLARGLYLISFPGSGANSKFAVYK